MYALIFFIVGLLVAALHLYFDRQPRTKGRIVEIFLLWLLVIPVGLQGIWAFMGHTLFAEQTAEYIGWPAGNPFQTEVAVANLTVGTLGILCFWIRGNFWTAAVIAASVWKLGAVATHVREIVVAGNYNPGNAGMVFYMGIVVPLILIALLVYLKRVDRHKEREATDTAQLTERPL